MTWLSVRISVALLVTTAACGVADPGSGRGLLRDAAEFDYPRVYRFTDQPDADQLMECLVGDQAIVGVIDEPNATAAFSFESAGFPQVIWTSDRVYVWANLVTDQEDTDWVWVERSGPVDQQTALGDALGPALEAYAFSTELPEHPADLARGASQVSSSADVSARADGGQTVMAVVSDETLVIDGGGLPGEDLELEFMISAAGRIDSVGVHTVTKDPDGTQSFGYTLTYAWNAATAVVVPSASSATNVAGIDLASLRRSNQVSECSIGP